jgi:hypothetical protein
VAALAPDAGADEDESDDAGAAAPPTGGGGAGGGDGTDGYPSGPEYDAVEGGEHKLAAIAREAWVYAGPNDSTLKLGYLRAGAVVDRGEKPVAMTKRCKGGWFRVVPRGFVCNGKRATVDSKHPIAVASWRPPARGEPLPYKYGRSKEQAPYLYHRVPSIKEQERAELFKFSDQIKTYPKERFIPITGEPEPLPPFLSNGQSLLKPFGVTQHLHVGPHEGKSNSHSAFAFMSTHDIEGRVFGLSTDLNLIPLDRLNLAKVTEIHGGEVNDLPAAIALLGGAGKYRMDEKGNPKLEGKLERFQTVSFTGVTKGELWETRDGYWVPMQGLKLLKKRDGFPSFVTADAPKKWIDVSIQHQLLIAYEGTKAVYVAQVSTGLAGMADPETTTATKRGVFSIKAKHITGLMTGDEAVDDYELADVPYVQYFEGSYALHAAFWHEDFGHPHSHGCVNLPPTDAAWLFEWTEPKVLKQWHGMQANGAGTIVLVRY